MALRREMVTQSAGPATRSVVASASGGTQWRVPMSIDDSRAAPREAEAALDYTSLFLLEYPAVVRTVTLMLRDSARAEEIAQDAFVQLHLAWAKVSRYERPGAWVRRIAIRLAMRAIRRDRLWALVGREPSRASRPSNPGRTWPARSASSRAHNARRSCCSTTRTVPWPRSP